MELNKETIKKIRGLIVFAVVAVVAGVNYQKLFGLMGSFAAMASPFLLGGAIAFIVNVPMRAIETRTPIRKSRRFRRPMWWACRWRFLWWWGRSLRTRS